MVSLEWFVPIPEVILTVPVPGGHRRHGRPVAVDNGGEQTGDHIGR